ncbi:protein of unknown function DUF721 [[Leptolyngbya] sp. PCC 7376]|uniref:DUF721 domain-containing protein n=1 Tax=[Leptolyngbya] sp. PCC 7376 TaxID=111781 RepID=UPI00029F4084|nr:DciA family protein [[Leptolyngbya] sp. PCC 7376]AFY36941.1 protein of unknown function DUF721 [[Leptolyngbya] sp. PCC 7376]
MTLRPLESVLQHLMHQKAWEHQQHFQTLTTLWQQQLPTKTILNSRPHSIQNKILIVSTSNNTWSQHLTLQRINICTKLNTKLKPSQTLEDIRFTTAHWHQKPAYSPLADPDLLHPSRTDSPSPKRSRRNTQSPSNAVRSWLEQRQQQFKNQPLCPKCQAPTPSGELERWKVCRCCVAQEWHRNCP